MCGGPAGTLLAGVPPLKPEEPAGAATVWLATGCGSAAVGFNLLRRGRLPRDPLQQVACWRSSGADSRRKRALGNAASQRPQSPSGCRARTWGTSGIGHTGLRSQRDDARWRHRPSAAALGRAWHATRPAEQGIWAYSQTAGSHQKPHTGDTTAVASPGGTQGRAPQGRACAPQERPGWRRGRPRHCTGHDSRRSRT